MNQLKIFLNNSLVYQKNIILLKNLFQEMINLKIFYQLIKNKKPNWILESKYLRKNFMNLLILLKNGLKLILNNKMILPNLSK